jgi:hypothetical protein
LATDRGAYKFFIVADTADYKHAEREGNTVTSYINGNLILTGSNVESTQAGNLNATIETRLDLLVPVFDGSDEDGNKQLVENVRKILDDYFSTNGDGEEDGYYYGWQYNIAVSGARANLPAIGDSFLFSVDITWYFIQNGVSSKSIVLKMKHNGTYPVVDYLTFGISRSSTQESDTPADTDNGAAGNVDLASVMSIHFTMPLLRDAYVSEFVGYALGMVGIGKAQEMKITIPPATTPQTFNMYISDVKINAEGATNASLSVTMTEVL